MEIQWPMFFQEVCPVCGQDLWFVVESHEFSDQDGKYRIYRSVHCGQEIFAVVSTDQADKPNSISVRELRPDKGGQSSTEEGKSDDGTSPDLNPSAYERGLQIIDLLGQLLRLPPGDLDWLSADLLKSRIHDLLKGL